MVMGRQPDAEPDRTFCRDGGAAEMAGLPDAEAVHCA